MKTVKELQNQLENSESATTRFEIMKIMASRALELEKENSILNEEVKDARQKLSLPIISDRENC